MEQGKTAIVINLTLAMSFGWVTTQLPEPEPTPPAARPPVVVVVPDSAGQGALVPVQTGEGSTQAPAQTPARAAAPQPAPRPNRSLVGSELKGRLRVEGKNPKVYELRETRSGESVITQW